MPDRGIEIDAPPVTEMHYVVGEQAKKEQNVSKRYLYEFSKKWSKLVESDAVIRRVRLRHKTELEIDIWSD